MPHELDIDDLVDLNAPITIEKIRALRRSADSLLELAKTTEKLGKAKLEVAQRLCTHPSLENNVCPDCGFHR